MKWLPNKAFPYPVLFSGDNIPSAERDYVDGEFSVKPTMAVEQIRQEANLAVKFRLSQPSLLKLIAEGHARYAAGVHCGKTYLRLLKTSDNPEIRISFPKGALDGNVDVSAYVVCYKPIPGYTSKEFHPEFEGRKFSIKAGSVLAIVRPLTYKINLDPMQALGTIFTLAGYDNIDSNFKVDWETDKIRIMMNPEDAAVFGGWQENKDKFPFMLSSVYLTTLMETLYLMTNSHAQYAGKKWFEVIEETASGKGIKLLPDMDYLDAAQKLLASPIHVMLNEKGDE